MQEFRADLHCHTTCSDGTLSPIQLIQHAKQLDLQGLAITDHDSIDAYASALPAAQEAGIELISGVEFSAEHDDASIHVLGYSFSLDNPLIHQLCQQHKLRRETRNRAILERLAAYNMPLTEEDIIACTSQDMPQSQHTIGRPHIAQAMVKKGYVNELLDAFRLYIGEGKPCYVPGKAFHVDETIDFIHQANGFAILAHPYLIKETHLVPALLKMPFDGLEGYYARLTAGQYNRWIKIANAKNWLITGGSDFHGEIKANNPLGCSWIGEDTFRVLQKRYLQNSATPPVKS